MLIKNAKYRLEFADLRPLHLPSLKESVFIDQGIVVDINDYRKTITKIASNKEAILETDGDAQSDFDLEAEIKKHPDSLFVKCFAIKADETNDNGDFFGYTELKSATDSFVGVPVFTNHQNSDVNEARGKVIYSWWDEDKKGIMIIARVDSAAYPQLARGIKEQYIAATSMGASRGHDLVSMADGTKKRVNELQVGDPVYTHSGNIEKVAAVCETQKHNKLYHIKWSGDKNGLALSYEHPVLIIKRENLYHHTRRNGRKCRMEPDRINKDVRPEFVAASELKYEDYVLEPIDQSEPPEIKRPKFDSFFYQNYIAHKIKDVTVIDNSEPTYYVQVGELDDSDSDHSYILNDIATHNCFLGHNRVLMGDGTYVPIKDIQPGDNVITHAGNIKKVANSQIRTKSEQLVSISYEGFGSSMQVTQNHPILTLSSQSKCACGCGNDLLHYKKGSHRANNWKTKYRKRFINGHSQNIWNSNKNSKTHLSINKDLVQSSRKYRQEDFTWKPAGELKAGDVVVFPSNYQQHYHDVTLSQAKLIGYFLAEGSYKKYDGVRKEVNFSFCYSKEKDTYANEVIGLLYECFGDNISIWTQNRFPDADVMVVCCHNQEVAEWFYGYCGEYSTRKQMNSQILNWSHDLQKTILGTFINGDGCTTVRYHNNRGKITPYTSISINTSSLHLAEQFSTILSRNSIWHTFRANHAGKTVELKKCAGAERISCIRSINGETQDFNVLPNYIIEVNQNYADHLLPFTDKQKPIFNKTNTYQRQDDILVAGPYVCRKIKSVDLFVYSGPVFNIEVEDDHSYIVEGAAVKNCQVKFSICSVCHNYAETPDQYCSCIKERKTRKISAKKQKCKYFEHGPEDTCPMCASTRKEIKTFNYDGEVFEYNYGIKFIENSFVVNPACHDCGVTEVIDPKSFVAKVAHIQNTLPRLIKIAKDTPLICTDKTCANVMDNEQAEVLEDALSVLAEGTEQIIKMSGVDFLKESIKKLTKKAGQKELDDLNTALQLITSVSQSMLTQKDQIDLEFLSDLVEVLSDLQDTIDELTEQGYGRLQSPAGGDQATVPETTTKPTDMQTEMSYPGSNAPQGTSKVKTGPAGDVGTVTGPLADRRIELEKLSKFLTQTRNRLNLSFAGSKKNKLDLGLRLPS